MPHGRWWVSRRRTQEMPLLRSVTGRCHMVKSGTIGWAQVRHRYGATFDGAEEKSIQVVLFGKGDR